MQSAELTSIQAWHEPVASAMPPSLSSPRIKAVAHAIGRWLRRALAESARAWALAAGVPPDLYT